MRQHHPLLATTCPCSAQPRHPSLWACRPCSPGAAPPRLWSPRPCVGGSGLDAHRAAATSSPWDQPCGPTGLIGKGPVPLKLYVWGCSLGLCRGSPLRTNPTQRMRRLEPSPVDTLFPVGEAVWVGREAGGKAEAPAEPELDFSLLVPSPIHSTPSKRLTGLVGGCGPSGQDFSLAHGQGL